MQTRVKVANIKDDSMQAYQGLNQQFIGGHWTTGTSTKSMTNRNPYQQTVIFEMQFASVVDVDSAYSAAQKAFDEQVIKSAEVRKQVITKLQQVIQQRREVQDEVPITVCRRQLRRHSSSHQICKGSDIVHRKKRASGLVQG